MLKFVLILMFVCIQLSLIHCYTINHLQRPLWSELEGEPNEEFLAKLFRTETFLNEVSPPATGLFEQADGHPRGLQKRGRQCLWKVCSWALDKRSSPSNSFDGLSKLLY